MGIEEHDNKMTHCRMLGHEVPFSYCRNGATGKGCRKMLDCWFQAFNVEAFLKANYSEQELEAVFAPPTPKMTTLMDLIQKAQQSAPDKSG